MLNFLLKYRNIKYVGGQSIPLITALIIRSKYSESIPITEFDHTKKCCFTKTKKEITIICWVTVIYLRELYSLRIIYIKITYVSDVIPKTCPYNISTKYPEINANSNFLLVGNATAQYMFINSSHSGAMYPTGRNISVKISPRNILNKIIII
jgi:hypothetical protein